MKVETFNARFQSDDWTMVEATLNSTIYIGKDKDTQTHVVVKKLVMRHPTDHEWFNNELEMLTFLTERTNDHVVRLHESYKNSLTGGMALELCSGGDLLNFRARYFGSGPDLGRESFLFKGIVLQMSKALAFIHLHSIVHRDVKPENFVISKDGHIKLCDFGFATFDEQSTSIVCGTCIFIAPEAARDASQNKIPSDVWSLGVTVCDLAGFPVFERPDDKATFAYIKKIMFQAQVNRLFPTDAPPLAQTMFRLCQRIEPSERPEAADIETLCDLDTVDLDKHRNLMQK